MSVNHEGLQPRPRRVLNPKAFILCAVVIVLTSTGMRQLHSRQVVKTTAYLRQAADEAVEHGDPQEAIQALERYLFDEETQAEQEQLILEQRHPHSAGNPERRWRPPPGSSSARSPVRAVI